VRFEQRRKIGQQYTEENQCDGSRVRSAASCCRTSLARGFSRTAKVLKGTVKKTDPSTVFLSPAHRCYCHR
jgi:hypothetical protein